MFIKPNSGLFQSDPVRPQPQPQYGVKNGLFQSDPVRPSPIPTNPVVRGGMTRPMIGIGVTGLGINPSAGFQRARMMNSGMGNGPPMPQFNPFSRR